MREQPNIDALLQGRVSGTFYEWPQLRKEVKSVLAEIQRLTEECANLKTALSGRTYYHDNARVEEELERYKAALRNIAATTCKELDYTFEETQKVAREALKGDGE